MKNGTEKPENFSVVDATEVKPRKSRDAGYSLESIAVQTKKVYEAGLLNEEEMETIKRIHTNAVAKYLNGKYKF